MRQRCVVLQCRMYSVLHFSSLHEDITSYDESFSLRSTACCHCTHSNIPNGNCSHLQDRVALPHVLRGGRSLIVAAALLALGLLHLLRHVHRHRGAVLKFGSPSTVAFAKARNVSPPFPFRRGRDRPSEGHVMRDDHTPAQGIKDLAIWKGSSLILSLILFKLTVTSTLSVDIGKRAGKMERC